MGSQQSVLEKESQEEQENVPDTRVQQEFWWKGRAECVQLVGSFEDWKIFNNMLRLSDESFSLKLMLSPGYYQYKFVVDGVWQYSPHLEKTVDQQGNINNYVHITAYSPPLFNCIQPTLEDDKYYMENMQCNFDEFSLQREYQPSPAPQPRPPSPRPSPPTPPNLDLDFDEEGPPRCPGQLLEIYFMELKEEEAQQKWSKTAESTANQFSTNELKKPHHVTVNHVGLRKNERFNVSVITQRYKAKYTTYKYYTDKYLCN